MKRKIIAGIIIIGLIITTLPMTSARPSKFTDSDKYSDCYIEISGLLSINDYPRIIGASMWKLVFLRPDGNENPAAFIFYLYLMLDEAAEVTIYTEENGELLWQHDGEGEPEIRLFWFSGYYISTETEEGRLHKEFTGTVKNIRVNER